MIGDLEQAILTCLSDIKSLEVVGWPEDPRKDLSKPVGRGMLLVRYVGDRSSEPVGNAQFPMIQQTTFVFELRLLMRDLRSHTGAYEMLQSARTLLTGYQPKVSDPEWELGLKGFYHQESALIGAEESIWDFGAKYAIDLIYRRRRNAERYR